MLEADLAPRRAAVYLQDECDRRHLSHEKELLDVLWRRPILGLRWNSCQLHLAGGFRWQRARVGTDDEGYRVRTRSEEHTSELQSLMRSSYAIFCWKNKINSEIQTLSLLLSNYITII